MDEHPLWLVAVYEWLDGLRRKAYDSVSEAVELFYIAVGGHDDKSFAAVPVDADSTGVLAGIDAVPNRSVLLENKVAVLLCRHSPDILLLLDS